jgi:hypothetical protein
MTTTPVGMRCPECARDRTRVTRVRPGAVEAPTLTYVLIGVNVAVALAIGSLASWPLAVYLLVRHGRAGLKRTIPFGPALACGALVVLFLSQPPS